MRILVVEDEQDLIEVLKQGLEEEGYRVDTASDGEAAEVQVLARPYDLLIVDWQLPRMDGRTLTERLRSVRIDVPILLLTGRTSIEDRVRGLDAGADDYLTKPFAFEELFARVRALARRRQGAAPPTLLEAGPLRVDLLRREVAVGDHRLVLQPKEYAVLELLARRYERVVTRSMLAAAVWGSTEGTSDDAINMTVSRLRQQLEEAAPPHSAPSLRIATVRGIGYRLTSEEGSPAAT